MGTGYRRGLMVVFAGLGSAVAFNAMFLQRQTGTLPQNKIAAEMSAQRVAADRAKRLALDQPPAIEKPIDFDTVANGQASNGRAAQPLPPVPTMGRAEPQSPLPPQRTTVSALADPPVRFARFRPDAANVDAVPEAPDAEGDAETIRAVQRELIQRGYGPAQSDGIPGIVTRAAIMAFEYDNQMPLTGEATPALLKTLLLGPSAERTGAKNDAGRVRSAAAEHVMRTVQQSLSVVGYQAGRVDGRIGEETERAIREFEMDEGIVPSGRVSAELVTRLARAASSGKIATKR